MWGAKGKMRAMMNRKTALNSLLTLIGAPVLASGIWWLVQSYLEAPAPAPTPLAEGEMIPGLVKVATAEGCPDLLERVAQMAADPGFARSWHSQRESGMNRFGAYTIAAGNLPQDSALRAYAERCSLYVTYLFDRTAYQDPRLP